MIGIRDGGSRLSVCRLALDYIDYCIDAVQLRVCLLHAGYLRNRVQLEYLSGIHYFMLLPPPQQSATGFASSFLLPSDSGASFEIQSFLWYMS